MLLAIGALVGGIVIGANYAHMLDDMIDLFFDSDA